MRHLISFCLSFVLLLLPLASTGKEILPSIQDKENDQQIEGYKHKGELSIDDLLGPKDNFPFLPDNHRDSGTGKFNSF